MGYAVVAERYDLFKEVFVRHFHDVDWKTGVFQPNIITILVIAAAIRILWALLVPVVPLSDSNAYDTFALNLWQRGVYGWTPDSPTSYWPVGTSALYALVYQIFGHNYAFIVALNLLLSLAIIFFSYKVADLFFGESVARWAALLITIWPSHIFFITILASELPYMLLTLVGIYSFFKEDTLSLKNILIVGIAFSLAYYVRPLATTVLAVCALAAVIAGGRKISLTAIRFLGAILIMAVAVSPWAKRNYDLYSEIVPMSTNGGAVFWMGNTPGTEGGYHPLPDYVRGMNEQERNKALKQEALNYIKAEPGAFILRTAYKFFKFHLWETIGVTWNEKGIEQSLGPQWVKPLKLISQVFWFAGLVLGLAGVILFLRNSTFIQLFHPFLLLWASSAGLHALIVAQDRYHIPIVPFIFTFSAYAIHHFAVYRRELQREIEVRA